MALGDGACGAVWLELLNARPEASQRSGDNLSATLYVACLLVQFTSQIRGLMNSFT